MSEMSPLDAQRVAMVKTLVGRADDPGELIRQFIKLATLHPTDIEFLTGACAALACDRKEVLGAKLRADGIDPDAVADELMEKIKITL